MNEDQVRKTALFFFFALLSEELALEGVREATHRLHGKKQSDNTLWIQTLTKQLNRLWKKMRRLDPSTLDAPRFLTFSNPAIWPRWVGYHKKTELPILIAVLFVQILDLKAEEVSDALGLPLGTIQDRLARGFSQYGKLLHSKERTL